MLWLKAWPTITNEPLIRWKCFGSVPSSYPSKESLRLRPGMKTVIAANCSAPTSLCAVSYINKEPQSSDQPIDCFHLHLPTACRTKSFNFFFFPPHFLTSSLPTLQQCERTSENVSRVDCAIWPLPTAVIQAWVNDGAWTMHIKKRTWPHHSEQPISLVLFCFSLYSGDGFVIQKCKEGTWGLYVPSTVTSVIHRQQFPTSSPQANIINT